MLAPFANLAKVYAYSLLESCVEELLPMTTWCQTETEQTLDAVIEDLLATAMVYSPPVDTLHLARRLGLNVVVDALQAGRARLVALQHRRTLRQETIVVRPEPRPERLQWAVAHEIGEAHAATIFQTLSLDPGELPLDARERLANRFASHLLLPTAWFLADARQLHADLFALKQKYTTASHELIARRMLDIAEPQIVTVIDNGQVTWRESNLPGQAPPLLPLEQSCRQAAQPTGTAVISEDFFATVQTWQIQEPNWHREILRTHLHSEDF